jgi:transcriptional regulator GlxA family with amidase domain
LEQRFACFLTECQRSAAARVPGFVQRVRAHCAGHLAEPLSLAGLAQLVAMSPAHFGRRYRQATGVTPMADVRRQRAQAAHDLLLTTTLPLKAIAEQVGFCDAYHLSREIRRVYGRPPRALRAS